MVFSRATFQMSPHLVHRQYVSVSGLVVVVTVSVDRQLGHTGGVVSDVNRREEFAAESFI